MRIKAIILSILIITVSSLYPLSTLESLSSSLDFEDITRLNMNIDTDSYADNISTDGSSEPCDGFIIVVSEDYDVEAVREQLQDISDISVTDSIDNYLFAQCNISDTTADTDYDHIDMLLNNIRSIPGVLLAEEDAELELSAISDDYYSDTQWVLDNQGSYKNIIGTTAGIITSTPDIDLDVPEAWEIYNSEIRETKEVVVAIIDTGVDYKHQDLRDNMWINPGEIPDDGIDNDGNGYIDDIYGWDFYNNDATICHYEYNSRLKQDFASSIDCDDHGTHCAGIIAATANNKVGIAGIASNIDVKIMSLKIHGGPNRKGSISDAIRAIKYAVRSGASVCNMSWGTYTESTTLYNAMKEAGMLFITAAGNDGSNNDQKPLYPASFDLDNIISVGYVDANGILSPDSNYGKESVDIVVPSVDVFSTVVGSYSSMSGSSMAAAHMTGLAAMIYSSGNGLYPSNVRSYILENIKPLDGLEKYAIAPGIPSAFLLMEHIDTLERDTISPTIKITRSFKGSSILLILDAVDEQSGINQIRYFIGKKNLDDFAHGISGTLVTSNELSLAKSGFYTFYIRDNAGNETVYPHYVFDDNTPPTIATEYSVSFDYSKITINASYYDSASGVRSSKYADDTRTNAYFAKASAGTLIPIEDNAGSFVVTEPGEYSIYAVDYRGNKRTVTINAEIIKSTSLKLSRSKKTLTVGKTYTIKSTLLPENTTDALKYKSSDKTVAKVSKKGKITALKPGKATITVTTASGLKKKIKITVKEPST